jgi:hypothetical protein
MAKCIKLRDAQVTPKDQNNSFATKNITEDAQANKTSKTTTVCV